MKKFRCRLKDIHCTALINIIDLIKLNLTKPEADECLLIAVLDEVALRMKARQLVYKKEYKFSFTSSQAFSLRMLWVDYLLPQNPPINDFTNRMRQLNTEILTNYNL